MHKEVFKPRYNQLEVFLRLLSKPGGGKFVFHCNFNYSKLPIFLPDFHKECIIMFFHSRWLGRDLSRKRFIHRILHGRAEIRNFSSSGEKYMKYFFNRRREISYLQAAI